MGWCQDFSVEIAEGCTHPMRPGLSYCSCDECGVVCRGKFEGCPEVWLQLTATPRDAAKAAMHPALQPPPGGGEHRRSIRLAEPMEVPDSTPPLLETPPRPVRAGPAPPAPAVEAPIETPTAPATARRAETEQSVKEWLAGVVSVTVQAALAEQVAASDLRFAQLNDAVAQIEADAATGTKQVIERLKSLLSRHHESVEARLGTFQSELQRLALAISEFTQHGERNDPEPQAHPSASAAATVVLEEAVAALSDENQQLRARLASQETLVDDLQRGVSDLVSGQARLDRGAVAASLPGALDELADLRREVGRLRSQVRGNGEAFRRSVEERIGAVESRGEELEARITARIEAGLASRFAAAGEVNRQHDELRQELARRQSELENRLVAQRQTLVALQGSVTKLALRKDVRTASAPTTAVTPGDEERGDRESPIVRPSHTRPSGRRTELSALLGAHWHGRTDEPAGDRGDRAPSPEEPTPEELAQAKP